MTSMRSRSARGIEWEEAVVMNITLDRSNGISKYGRKTMVLFGVQHLKKCCSRVASEPTPAYRLIHKEHRIPGTRSVYLELCGRVAPDVGALCPRISPSLTPPKDIRTNSTQSPAMDLAREVLPTRSTNEHRTVLGLFHEPSIASILGSFLNLMEPVRSASRILCASRMSRHLPL